MMPLCCFSFFGDCWPNAPVPFRSRGAKYLAITSGPTVLVVKVEITPWKKNRNAKVLEKCYMSKTFECVPKNNYFGIGKKCILVTWADTSRKLVSPLPDGWSIADELTIKSTFPKASLTLSAALLMSSSEQTSSFRTVSLFACCALRAARCCAASGFLHVAITAVVDLFKSRYLQNSKPRPLLAPCTSATAAMTPYENKMQANLYWLPSIGGRRTLTQPTRFVIYVFPH